MDIESVIKQGPFAPTWESLEHCTIPPWYLDAKFGIFIHWGVYSVPAFGNEWYPRSMYQQGSREFGHHLAMYGPQTQFGYKDFIPRFTAERFDPAGWAELFRKAGARYVVPVAEHHDGFAMYDCSLSRWTATKMGPKRDVIGQLAEAVRAEGMILGLSSHRAEHWWFFEGGRAFDSDVRDEQYAELYGPAASDKTQPDAAFLGDWLARTCELVDKYRPQLVYFDWWIEQPAFAPYLQKFAAYYYNRAAQWKTGVAINYKHGAFPPRAAVLDVERGQLADIRPRFWQTCTSVSRNSWGYINHHRYKTAGSIVGDLADIVSKNGTLLLNIGPRADGTIPEIEQQMLLDIGRWLEVNGEAIYGTRPFKVFGEGPTKVSGGSFADTQRADYTAQDIRFTLKGDTLYAIALAWPEGEVTIHSLAASAGLAAGKAKAVELLGCDAKLTWSQDARGLRIRMPRERPCEHAYVFKITALRELAFDSVLRVDSSGVVELPANRAELLGGRLQIAWRDAGPEITNWINGTERVAWMVQIAQAGTYEVAGLLACGEAEAEFAVELAGQTLTGKAPRKAPWEAYQPTTLGRVEIAKAGEYTLTVRPADPQTWGGMTLAGMTLRRVS